MPNSGFESFRYPITWVIGYSFYLFKGIVHVLPIMNSSNIEVH